MKKAINRLECQSLEEIPGIGESIAKDLRSIGIEDPKHLEIRVPEEVYHELRSVMGKRHDPCLLYVLLAAEEFLKNDQIIPWWKYAKQIKD